MPASSSTAHASSGWCGWRRSTRQENSMSSRSAAKMARPASKPVSKSSARKPKAKQAKVTKFPTASMKKPLPAAKRSSPPPAARKSDPPPRGMPALTPPKQVQEPKQSRSEEHTSELQSRLHLVCRLLLEKKKKNNTSNIHTPTHTDTTKQRR